MKFGIGFLLFIWLMMTIILAFSVIGMVLFVPFGYERSSWMEIGIELKNKVISFNDK